MTKDWVHGVGHSPVCQILLQIVVRAVITSSPPAWTSSTGMLSTPADFRFFNDCTAASTSLRRMGWSFSVTVWVQFSTDGSPLALRLYNSEQYSVHRLGICRSSVRHFPDQSWTVVAFPCFTVAKPFTSWYALLLLFFLRFSSISLHCSPPVFCSLFHAPFDVVVHFLVFLISFRLKAFLSQFSPFATQIKNFCSDPGFFLLKMFAKDLTGCFSHCCVEGGDHWIYVCIFVAHDGERCKSPAYHSLEGFQHVMIFQLFEVKLESCVFWLADFFNHGGQP